MPAFSRVSHDAVLLRDAIANALRAVSLIALPMCALLIALARPLVFTLYGARWAAAANVLSVLALYGAIAIICTLFANILAAMGRAKLLLVVQLIWLGVLVPAMSVGVHRNGIVGAAVAHIVVITPIVLPIYVAVLMKVTGIGVAMLAKAVRPAVLTSLAMGSASWEVASHLSSIGSAYCWPSGGWPNFPSYCRPANTGATCAKHASGAAYEANSPPPPYRRLVCRGG